MPLHGFNMFEYVLWFPFGLQRHVFSCDPDAKSNDSRIHGVTVSHTNNPLQSSECFADLLQVQVSPKQSKQLTRALDVTA